MNYHSLFLSKIRKDIAKFVVCCSHDWRFKGKHISFSLGKDLSEHLPTSELQLDGIINLTSVKIIKKQECVGLEVGIQSSFRIMGESIQDYS